MKYIKWLLEVAENRLVSECSSRNMARVINKKLKKDHIKDSNGSQLTIGYRTINKILNKFISKPRTIRKVFFLSNEQKIKRVEFCKMILEKKWTGKEIFFTDETQIDLSGYIHDKIRLSKENEKKLQEGQLDVYDLITRPQKKFEKSIMVAGGISFYGVGKLMLLNGTENEFCYAQAILNYKKDIERLNKNLIFEQDGARSHTSISNKALLNKKFKNWIQNPPNSPDIVYPIEDLWGILKNRVKRRNPKDLDELTIFMFEEWYSIPQTLINNLFKNFIKRIKKILELEGARLEDEHLKQIKEKGEGEYGDGHKWEKKDFKILKIYNDEELLKLKNRHIAALNKNLNKVPKSYKKKLIKISNSNPEPNKKIGFISYYNRKRRELLIKKRKSQNQIKELIEKNKKMDLESYLKFLKKEENEEKENEEEENEEIEKNEEETEDASIANILELKKIQEKDKNIEYNLAF